MNERLDNFKGKMHRLTKKDRIKGGQTRSDLKRNASRVNSITTGKYTKGVKYCSTCLLAQFCPEYEAGHGRICKLIEPKTLRQIMDIKGFKTTQEYDYYVFDFINSVVLADKAGNKDGFKLLCDKIIEITELKAKIRK